ncbi:MAG: hypothetical protein IPL35_09310 [Sphingobacteriales bacterium]|nr:hypothetical protein [Sphingobacteriales bacterium]
MEVVEAIPHNGAILHDMGINVASNSDDLEMARRLNNTEAAKAVKYGGVTEEECVEIPRDTESGGNAVDVEQRTGQDQKGKDADVLWSEHSLIGGIRQSRNDFSGRYLLF